MVFLPLLVSLFVVMAFSYYLTTFWPSERAIFFPRITILATLSILVLAIFNSVKDGGLASDATVSVRPFGLISSVIWISLYLVSIYYIGFFTSSFAFIFIHIMAYHDDSFSSRLVSATLWSSAIVAILYVVLIRVLFLISILRIGLLP